MFKNYQTREVYDNLSLIEGFKYSCDTNYSYPWYDRKSCVTIEGPTKKHNMVRLQVSLFNL